VKCHRKPQLRVKKSVVRVAHHVVIVLVAIVQVVLVVVVVVPVRRMRLRLLKENNYVATLPQKVS
jgi:hypothetical protein